MTVTLPPWATDAAVLAVVLTWIADKVYNAIVSHHARVAALQRQSDGARWVTPEQCLLERNQCREGMNCRMDDGNKDFAWIKAAIRILARKADISADDIEREIKMGAQRG